MKNFYSIILLCVVFNSCNQKTVLLPEIKNSNITDIKDISAAYLFYDESQPDSVELNRKNLISSTNWLVNVDKRLTLAQAIPHIKFLQDKKQNSSHKNKDAKNYFTCNDTNRKNLGFIDFTDVVYHEKDVETNSNSPKNYNYAIASFTKDSIFVNGENFNPENLILSLDHFIDIPRKLILHFDSDLTFQDYIRYKAILLELKSPNISVENQEFIY